VAFWFMTPYTQLGRYQHTATSMFMRKVCIHQNRRCHKQDKYNIDVHFCKNFRLGVNFNAIRDNLEAKDTKRFQLSEPMYTEKKPELMSQ
jgi:hypothetical protein